MKSILGSWRATISPRPGRELEMVRPSGNVLSATIDERCVLLDLRAGNYHGLDEVGTRIWQAIERGATTTEVTAELALDYEAPIGVLATDTRRFIRDLYERRLVVSAMNAPCRPPRLLACFAQLAFVDACLRIAGLRKTFALARRAAVAFPARHDAALLAETARRLVLAAAFYPRRALCLEQSLALYMLLRRRGIAAEVRLGVTPLPFFAHAWVEVNGQPLDEGTGLPLQLGILDTPDV